MVETSFSVWNSINKLELCGIAFIARSSQKGNLLKDRIVGALACFYLGMGTRW